MRLSFLPASAFYEPVIFVALLKRLSTSWFGWGLLPIILIAGVFYKRWWVSWHNIEKGQSLRLFCILLVALLAWMFTTYDFNLFYNENHYVDRVLLLIFVALVYWRPVFIFPFLLLLLPVIWQFVTVGGYSWTIQNLLIKALMLFCILFLVYCINRKFFFREFLFLIPCLVAAHYWYPSSEKMNMDWILYDHIAFLLPATYTNGWLSFMEPEFIASVTEVLDWFNSPLKLFLLIIEFGALLFFINRKAYRFFLVSWIIMHIGVFLVSGICFWVWVLVDIALLILLTRVKVKPLFTNMWVKLLVGALIIMAGPYWCNPTKLSWYDSPLSYTFHFEALTENGNTFELSPAFFAPYDYQFTMKGFTYLIDQPICEVTLGAAFDPKLPLEVNSQKSVEAVFEYEKTKGSNDYDQNKIAGLESFVKQCVGNWNQRLSKKTSFSLFKAPRPLWTFPANIDFQEKIKSVEVHHITALYKEGVYTKIRDIKVREILIPPQK